MFIPHSRTIVLLFAILLSGPLVPATGTAFAETMMPLSGKQEPLRLAIARITHGHSAWIFGNKATDAVRVVGIYEPDKALASRFRERYDLPTELFYDNLEDMLKATRPEAVAAFGSIYEHLGVVEACAPRGIHVMVEKPLATNVAHAKKMESLAREHQIRLLTNYETSWYPTVAKTGQLVSDSNSVGHIRKIVVHAGHQGPQEIGVGPEFLEWLTDPKLNGGGALIDFGCYGANLATWLMKGALPESVTAVTRQYKPARYPQVDDDATIIVNYSDSQCIIQASWNWPFNRKDMAVYGDKGYIITTNSTDMRVREAGNGEQYLRVTPSDIPVYENPFLYLADVIRGKTDPGEHGLYSLNTNVTVVRILEAARQSAKAGKTIYLDSSTGR